MWSEVVCLDAYGFLMGRLLGFREPISFEPFIRLRHTPRRFLNYLLANAEYRLGRTRLISRPYQAYIDPCNACNLKCPLCPTGNGTPGRKKGMMTLGDFRKALDRLGGTLYSVHMYNWGEPFLNPELFEMVKCVKSKRIAAIMSSNLNVRITDFGEKVVKSGLDYLHVSLDGTDQKTYEGYRRGGSYALAKSNLKAIIVAKKRLGSSTPFVAASYLVMRHNEKGVEKFKKEMLEMGVDSVYVGKVLLEDYEAEKGFLPVNEEFSAYSPDGKRKKQFFGCSFPWTTAYVFPDLSVTACCWNHYFAEEHDVGSLREQPFHKLWNSGKYRALRKVIRDRIPGTKIPCSKCVEGRHPYDAAIEWVAR